MIQFKKMAILMQIKSLQGMDHTPHLANEDLKLRGWERDAFHNGPKILFIAKTKRLECPYGLKGKLQLMRGSSFRLPLCRT
jgi:hypothetical protein